jgi:hypothetical protein
MAVKTVFYWVEMGTIGLTTVGNTLPAGSAAYRKLNPIYLFVIWVYKNWTRT